MRLATTLCLLLLWRSAVNLVMAQPTPDASLFNQINQKSETTHSDALLVYQAGKPLVVKHYTNNDEPLYIASAGKSLTSLGIGRLLERKLLRSIDDSLVTFFPEWKQGSKRGITIRMLLNHTSGLQNQSNASLELEPAPTYKVPNVLQLALCAELDAQPGTAFSYNNKAVALLGAVIERASGKRMDHFFDEEFYKPMGIGQTDWIRDEAGNPTAHGAFILKPSDLLKFGELMLNEGIYQNQRYVSAQWVRESIQPAQPFDARFGLLWWILYDKVERTIDDEIIGEWRKAGVNESFLSQVRPIVNQAYSSLEAYNNALQSVLGDSWQETVTTRLNASGNLSLRRNKKLCGKPLGYYANGYRGNYVVVIPAAKLVAVRCKGIKNYTSEEEDYDAFPDDVAQAVLQLK